ncbi:regulatory protein [Geothermobacter ehrlichii]|uniref:Regulatory protein RecX n=1 Tax=Geothermobacter ehrlichii TaxID=213224 RepID=A0A5D3WGD3_9BACT|nr:regulatory protein RecX [Geothermobacter ehrlichii]TYO97494.1 regulatory protein [Geothermobacter ehrlichii]
MTGGRRQKKGGDAYATALRLLTRRDYSCRGLAERLRQRGFAPDDVAAAIDRCRRLGYLDDRRFAERTARNLVAGGRAWGRRLLLELTWRGIDPELAEQACELACGGCDPEALIRDLAARRYPDIDFLRADAAARRRLVQFFQRRGFALATIFSALEAED